MSRRDRRREAKAGAPAGSVDRALAAGVALAREGRLGEAAHAFERIAAENPADFRPFLERGRFALVAGRGEEALSWIDRAAQAGPREPAVAVLRGHALAALGRDGEAADAWAAALALRPGQVEAAACRADALVRLGRRGEAAEAYALALAIRPDLVALAVNGADNLNLLGRHEAAAAVVRAALAATPRDPGLLVQLGMALRGLGRPGEAAAALEPVVAAHPGLAPALANLGLARLELGDTSVAVDLLARAERAAPGAAAMPYNLAAALRAAGRLDEAVAALERATALAPHFADAHHNRGLALQDQGRLAEAGAAFAAALAADPDHARAAAAAAFRTVYDDRCGPAAIRAAHAAWAARFAAPLAAPPTAHSNPPDPARRLRVGYLSPDLRTHSVAYFLEPLLAAHDRAQVEVVLYADVARPDDTTARLRALADAWRPVTGLDDAAVAARVRQDGVDLLVDLAGHTTGGRPLVFARRPAPIQAAWLGYPTTTGLAQFDFRLTDDVADPPGGADECVEPLVRLPSGFLCWRPPHDAGPVAPPPSLAAGRVTFGSFNNLAKLTDSTAALWAAVLRAVSGARLLLKSGALGDDATRARLRARLAAAGVDPARVELAGHVDDRAGHLARYGAVDVALDTTPYGGTTTTCEALWMGVPVVTLAGDRHAGRVGASILRRVGLGDLVAATAAEYVAIAAALAADRARLAGLRGGMRARLDASPIRDEAGFARSVETAYRAAWARWCGGAGRRG